ncbi:MAG: DEAD/DEAH box helicase [Patescibacteria group bacterium]|jgi:ATP-dependent RNA helicase RhlE
MQKNEEKDGKASGFVGLGIDERILSILTKNGIIEPTLIQRKSIPSAIKGHDLMGVAQTGTGKTFAFGIPLVQSLLCSRGRALVLLPTRELANQVEENLKKIAGGLGMRTISIIGGEAFNRQLFSLKRNPNIIVATPGRLLDHIRRRTIRLDDISFLVLDEADMMFDMGFAPQIEELIKLIPTTRQTLLFSATMPAVIIKLAEKYLKTPLQIQVAPSGSTVDLIDQEIYLIKSEEKFKNLIKILGDYRKLVLIFVRTRYGASALCKRLNDNGFKSVEIHSNLSFNQRKKSLQDFKDASSRIMVATDVAARGLDINDIQLVLNYDLPDNSEDYVHRIGRTARAGKGGKAITFSLSNQIRSIQKIERLIKKNLPIRRMSLDGGLVDRTNKEGGNNSGNSSRGTGNNRGSNKKFFTKKPKGRSGNFNRRRR